MFVDLKSLFSLLNQTVQYQYFLQIIRKVTMASHNHAKEPVEKSRVSSSCSSQNHSYELLPRQQSYNNPNRDRPSPRASFPFKRVQSGLQGFQSKRNKNELQGNTKQEKKQQNEQKQLLQAIKQLNSHPQIRKQQGVGPIADNNVHEKCHRQIQKLTAQITELQGKLARESEEFQLEKKANEIFNQSFIKIRQILGKKNITLEGSSMEELVQKLDEAISKNKYEGNVNELLEEQDTKIRQLRAELLKSSQNNINAIFNTEITEAQCLNLQIKKMNGQIMYIKENIYKLSSENKIDANLIYHGPPNSKKDQKTVNIYHHNRSYDTSDDEDLYQKTKKYKKPHSKKKGSRQSRDRSSSDSNKKSRRLSNTQNKVGELVDGYKLLREEYRSLQQTIKQLNNNQSDYKVFFNTLKTEINSSINNQIKEVKQTIKRPSSNSEQRKIARDLQNKLNHLINTLNAPQRASLQKSVDQEQNRDILIEAQPKIIQLQARNQRLQHQNKTLMAQNIQLQQKVNRIQIIYRQKVRENELNLDLLESARKKAGRKLQLDELMNASRSDLKEQEIIEQFSVVQNSQPVVHTSNINKLHSSQSYHHSHTKSIQIQQLHRKLQGYQQSLREKQLRITELQNTIIDHFQSRAVVMQPLSSSQIKEKYQIYINNLKILLSEAKKENQVLRKEFIKVNELNLSRANQNQDRHSNTVSERTTKNALAQTRLMRRQVKQSNNYDSIQLKLRIEDEIEKIFLTFLQLYQQTFELVEQDRKPLANSLMSCINTMLKNARANRNRLFEETIQRQQVKNILYSLGLYQK